MAKKTKGKGKDIFSKVLERVGAPGSASRDFTTRLQETMHAIGGLIPARDFATEDYFHSVLLPRLQNLAKHERQSMQASWDSVRGAWRIVNAENQPTRRAFVIVDVDGRWREGPAFDRHFFSGRGGR
jgi:hypothetical protein